MSNNYRINVRFDMRKEQEKAAVEYLKNLSEKGSQTRNRFIVDAVIETIQRKQNDTGISLDDIRTMFREELKSVSVAKPTLSEVPSVITDFTEEEKEINDANVLSALAMFD